MYPRDQWTAKQMTWIRARVPMNFPWTREGPVIHSHIFLLPLLCLSFSLPHYNYSFCPSFPLPPLPVSLFIHFPSSFPSHKEPNAVVVLKLKSQCSATSLLSHHVGFWFWKTAVHFPMSGLSLLPSPPLYPIAADQEGSQAIGLIYPLCSGSKQQ